MPFEPVLDIENIPLSRHGGPDYAELQAMGLQVNSILDFSVCCNPYPLPAEIRRILHNLPVHLYPDSDAAELKNKIAQKLGIAPASILIGSGTTELIRLLAMVYLKKGRKVLLFKPTYSEYEITGRILGAKIIYYQGTEEHAFKLDATEFARRARRFKPSAVFLCNPNNPTGQYLSRSEIEIIAEACRDSLLVLDEAYINFVQRPWSSADLLNSGNTVILRSMTKAYALAGLRLGYMLAGEEIIKTIRRVCPPWNVNIAAQKIGLAALSADSYLNSTLTKIWKAREALVKHISELGYRVIPSDTSFFLVNVGNAGSFRRALLKQGFLVRDCTSFGLPEYIRIGARTLKESRLLIRALTGLKRTGGLQINGD